jgi:hypothetical protein
MATRRSFTADHDISAASSAEPAFFIGLQDIIDQAANSAPDGSDAGFAEDFDFAGGQQCGAKSADTFQQRLIFMGIPEGLLFDAS